MPIYRVFRSAPYRAMPASWSPAGLAAFRVIVLSGRVHFYERGDASAMRTPIETLKALGVETLILTNSAGSLREDLPPGSVMQITDHINFSGTSPLIGVDSDDRFVGLTSAYEPALVERMRAAAIKLDIPLGSGVYMWFSGPNFETPAEIRMARILGADAVGMSTVPEVILARFFGLKVAAASVITNFGAGMTGGELSHHETKGHGADRRQTAGLHPCGNDFGITQSAIHASAARKTGLRGRLKRIEQPFVTGRSSAHD